ncbi:hypothetical protein HY493_01230 [Candidatus Woesearchaeota archaeon]|nr:hypothetical protein [Candidatus Woesearchaeota archaeon]
MFPGIDMDKAGTMFRYCAKSTHRMVERDYVRRELEGQLSKLRHIANKDMKGQLAELERRIAAAMSVEKRIMGHQTEEDVFHRKLRDKIELLEKRLGVFLENREERAQRIRELESKIVERLASKSQKVATVKEGIKTLEKMHQELSKSGKFKRKLAMIDERLASMKGRLKALEDA